MTIALTFDDTLWRVQIAGSALADGYVRVERSINELIWETVRGATALEVTAGAVNVSDYEYTPGVENFYRVAPAVDETFDVPSVDQVFGDPYEVPPGIRELTFEAYGAGAGERIFSTFVQSGGGGGAYASSTLAVTPGETLLLRPGIRGVASEDQAGRDGNSSAVIRDTTLLVDADSGKGAMGSDTPGLGGLSTFPDSIGDITFAGGAGGARSPSAGGGGGGAAGPAGAGGAGGAGVSATGGAAGAGNAPGGNGGAGGDNGQPGQDGQQPGGGAGGKGGGAVSTNGAHGRITVHSWPAGASESDSIVVAGHTDVVLKNIRYPFLNQRVHILNWSDVGRESRSGVFPVKGRSNPVTVHDLRGSQQFTLDIVTDDLYDSSVDPLVQVRNLDLMLAVGGTLLVHVPADSPIPGGYVTVGDLAEDRIVRHGQQPYVFSLPCTVVAQPGPDVTPTTLIWATVFNTYGSWQALWAANPTWFDLYQTVASLDDPVVL